MLKKGKLTAKELLFLAELMEQGGSLIWRQICEDMSPVAYNIFSCEEKDALEKAYHEWNGDPEEFEPSYFCPQAGLWLDYYAAMFRELARECNGQLSFDEAAVSGG
ncbi:MAG: hypothetical protein DRN91_04810 [Candidatus Alkanophagales archaeon]|nr:MAG: hypothetical protein DRN91_04810 [Candidatus Alkanophagales archaeon]